MIPPIKTESGCSNLVLGVMKQDFLFMLKFNSEKNQVKFFNSS
jgi:hypothetical protein